MLSFTTRAVQRAPNYGDSEIILLFFNYCFNVLWRHLEQTELAPQGACYAAKCPHILYYEQS